LEIKKNDKSIEGSIGCKHVSIGVYSRKVNAIGLPAGENEESVRRMWTRLLFGKQSTTYPLKEFRKLVYALNWLLEYAEKKEKKLIKEDPEIPLKQPPFTMSQMINPSISYENSALGGGSK
jgi:hypothetical protein